MMIDFRSKFVLMKRVLGRLMSAKTNSAWGKWYFCTFTVGKMSLDDQIKALQEELAKARAWKEKVEKEVEAIADRMARRHRRRVLASALPSLDVLPAPHPPGHEGPKAKVHGQKTAKQRMSIVIKRLANSQINYGFRGGSWSLLQR